MCQLTFSNTCLSHWHGIDISWVASGLSDIALICISIQTRPYYSPISDHHCASWLASELSTNPQIMKKAILKTTFNIPSIIVIVPTLGCSSWLEQLYYLMTNDRELSGFACKPINQLHYCHFSILQLETLPNASWFSLQRSCSTWGEVFDKSKCVHVIMLVVGGSP